MVEVRAYALGVTELRGVAGATGEQQERIRTLAQQAFAPSARPLTVRDMIGPIYRRVPGQRVQPADEPTPADLDVLLAGRPVRPTRSAATWRLLEVVVAGLAWSSTQVVEGDTPVGLLAPAGLALPPVAGLVVGWCSLERAAAVAGLVDWLADADAWTDAAVRQGRPRPDVVVFQTRTD